MLEIMKATVSDRLSPEPLLLTEWMVKTAISSINRNNGESASNPFLLLIF
jgi:hypothetical protein